MTLSSYLHRRKLPKPHMMDNSCPIRFCSHSKGFPRKHLWVLKIYDFSLMNVTELCWNATELWTQIQDWQLYFDACERGLWVFVFKNEFENVQTELTLHFSSPASAFPVHFMTGSLIQKIFSTLGDPFCLSLYSKLLFKAKCDKE